ncbi:MAG: hypothetical protein R3A13_07315 [Bdellovibrionota bacterium]
MYDIPIPDIFYSHRVRLGYLALYPKQEAKELLDRIREYSFDISSQFEVPQMWFSLFYGGNDSGTVHTTPITNYSRGVFIADLYLKS